MSMVTNRLMSYHIRTQPSNGIHLRLFLSTMNTSWCTLTRYVKHHRYHQSAYIYLQSIHKRNVKKQGCDLVISNYDHFLGETKLRYFARSIAHNDLINLFWTECTESFSFECYSQLCRCKELAHENCIRVSTPFQSDSGYIPVRVPNAPLVYLTPLSCKACAVLLGMRRRGMTKMSCVACTKMQTVKKNAAETIALII